MKNVDLWGGGRNKEFGPFGGRNLKYGHVCTKSLENRPIVAKRFKKSNDFSRDFWTINVHICICAAGARNFLKFFLINAAKEHSKRPFYGILFQIVDLWPAWWGRIPLISPQPTPMITQVACQQSIREDLTNRAIARPEAVYAPRDQCCRVANNN